jgi:hypothetical protein
MALGGARGELMDAGVAGQLVLGYGVDFPWSSLSLRLRLGRDKLHYDDHHTTGHQGELMAGLGFSRVMDLRFVSLGLGVLFEAGSYRQTRGDLPARVGYGVNFAALISLERALFMGASLHLEGGPMTALFRRAQIEDGVIHGDSLASVLTWWAAGGVSWRL